MADRVILEPFIAPATDDDGARYLDWLRGQAGPADEPAMDFLKRLNSAIHAEFRYGVRERARRAEPSPRPCR